MKGGYGKYNGNKTLFTTANTTTFMLFIFKIFGKSLAKESHRQGNG
jgi:hypothetical protein